MADDDNEFGRPTEYRREFAEQAEKLCALGATDHEIADFFGVSTRTLYRWKNTKEGFCQALKVAKEAADARVERSLFNRAVGYTFESEKVFQYQGEIVRAKTLEHVPPEPGAAFNWLKNRKPDVWREKSTQEITGKDGKPLIEAYSDADRVKALMALLAKGGEKSEQD